MSFFKNNQPKSPLPQNEREAIIDLLHLCLYADAHIALREGEMIADVVETIGWDTRISFGSYESRSIAAARTAKETPEAKKPFISFAAERLQSPESRALALDLCKQLFSADGTTAENETTLLGQIRTALK
jgi:uncharacterized tellurite resistance protein B-like protein